MGNIFYSSKIEQILTNYQGIQFEVYKNTFGRLILAVNAPSIKTYKQLSLFDL